MLGEYISMVRYAGLVTSGRQQLAPWLKFDPDVLKASYNRRPFLVEHRLAEHPHFSLAQLFALCRRLPPTQIACRFGNVPGDTDFDASYGRYSQGLTVEDAIEHLEEKQAYICIYNPELDSEYRPVIEGLLGEIAASTKPLDPGISWYSTYVFITAHDSVTPYHSDREMNFLLQVRGTKTVRLWDPSDGEIVTPAQKDLLLSYSGRRPPYQPSFESKAMSFELRPGLGVHHPFIAPHRVHTGPKLSISLALTFRTRRSDIWTDAHRFNQRLRGLGLRPGQVGNSPLIDRTKAGLLRMAKRVRHVLHGADKDAK